MAKGSINKSIIVGTLGRDPEVRYMPSGTPICTMSVATDEGYKHPQTGQQVAVTEWHNIETKGRLAEICMEYLKSGSKAYFEGKLRTNEYEKDGIKRYSTEIVVNDMMMLDGRQQDAGMGANAGYANTAPMAQSPSAAMAQQPGGYAPQQPAQQPPQGGYAPQGQPAQQPQQAGYAQQPNQRPVQQPAQQGGYAQPQQSAQPAQQGGFAPQNRPAQQPQAAPQPANNFDSFDDDIPF